MLVLLVGAAPVLHLNANEFSLLEVVKSLLESDPARTWDILASEVTEMKKFFIDKRQSGGG